MKLPFQPVISQTGSAYSVKITPGILRQGDTGAGVGVVNIGNAFPAGDNQTVFLEATIAGGVVMAVTAKCQGNWSGYPKNHTFATTPPFAQTRAYVELGRIGTAEGGTAGELTVNNAWASGHMMIVQAIVDGRQAWTFSPGNA